MASLKKIAFIVPYFGKWPQWKNLFLQSCINNPTIDFYFFTDSQTPEVARNSSNLYFKELSFDDYCSLISDRLNISFHPSNPYKLCDVKPFYGIIHQDILKINKYDFWGFCDIDLIMGDIRAFYDEQVLSTYNYISTHADRISGHMCLIRNEESTEKDIYKIPKWKEMLTDPKNHAVDEMPFAYTIFPPVRWLWKIHKYIFFKFFNLLKIQDEWTPYCNFCLFFNKIFGANRRRILFKEQNTTPFVLMFKDYSNQIHPDYRFIYKDGKIFNISTKQELIYLHFLTLKQIWNDDYMKTDALNSIEINTIGITPYK